PRTRPRARASWPRRARPARNRPRLPPRPRRSRPARSAAGSRSSPRPGSPGAASRARAGWRASARSGSCEHLGLDEAGRPRSEQRERVADALELHAMADQRLQLEGAALQRVQRGADAADIDLRIALMSIDHVEAAPVPVLHVDEA